MKAAIEQSLARGGVASPVENYGVFQRGNLWPLETAFAAPNANVTLVALWDPKEPATQS